MPTTSVTRAAPAGRQRVRTGCLTCRKRRRKCDERKPQCENCEIKGFSCQYRSGLTFVAPSKSASGKGDDGSNGHVTKYPAIKFVDDGHTIPISSKKKGVTLEQHAEGYVNGGDSARNEGPQHDSGHGQVTLGTTNAIGSASPSSFILFQDTVSPHHDFSYETSPRITVRPMQDNILGFSPTDTARSSSTGQLANSQAKIIASSMLSKPLPGRLEAMGTEQETRLLLHYRYNLATWIDVGDPGSAFGIRMMLVAKESQALFTVILALAACHRALISVEQNSSGIESVLEYREKADNGLMFAEDDIRRLGNLILILGDFLSTSPREWRSLLMHHYHTTGALLSLAGVRQDLSDALVGFYLRIDLASAVASAQPPLLPFRSYLRDYGSPGYAHQPPSQSRSAKHFFQHILFLLASCLSLVYEGPETASSVSGRTSSFSSEWTSLWADCQRWYNDRPVELQQIVEIRGIEIDRVDEQNSSSFPILLYTTPLALVANAIYHMASLLLVSHRPRLLKTMAGPRHFMSQIWHAQSISGIVTSNDSPEQWDPILIMGLIWVAKDLTHESQQSAVLERLKRSTTTTGIKLDREIDALKSGWKIAGHDEG